MKRKLFHLAVISLLVVMVVMSESIIEYARSALRLCYEVIIPTLFPFFVCSGLLVYSGFAGTLSKLLRPVMRPLFGVGENGAGAFVLGLLSGYPLGAVTVCQLYGSRYISKQEGERLLAFCNNSGPLFIMGAVGVSMYSGITAGLLLYGAHAAAAVTVGVIFRLFSHEPYIPPASPPGSPDRSIAAVYAQVMADSVKSILTVCGSVVFFSCLSRALLDLVPGLHGVWYAAASGILEFSTGTAAVAALDIDRAAKLVLTSAIIGFSGLGVHAQVMSVTSSSGLSLKPYIIGKILHGLIAAVYTWATMAAAEYLPAGVRAGGMFSGAALAAGAAALVALIGAVCRFGRSVKHGDN